MNTLPRWSVKTGFTLFAGAVAALLCTLCATVFMVATHYLAGEYLTDEVTAAGDRVASQLEMRGHVQDPLPQDQIRYIQVVSPQGKVAAATRVLRGRPPMAPPIPEKAKKITTSVVCGKVFPRHECDLVVAQQVYLDGQRWTVYSAAPVVPAMVDPRLAGVVLGGMVLLPTSVIVYLSRRIAARTLRPVNVIRFELDEVNATCPGRRVPIPPGHDEIHDLAESINHTLGRLQTALEQQCRFASDASHDLRSPLTAMRVEVEDALGAPQLTSVNAVGSAVLRGLDRLEGIVSDLLTITRLDADVPGPCDQVDLAELVTTEMYGRPRRTKTIECRLRGGVLVLGDRLRLARLLVNLLDNAERHADTAITIRVYHHPDTDGDRRPAFGAAVLEVLDDGAGITPDQRELVFQRFARLDASRRKDPGGTGLGLPIARQIAEMTGGTLTIQDSPCGARFVLCLPLAPGVTPAD
ncbi:sensor histidine kinase [Streptosporangium sp. NBC_01469]|uniref:sensor histidine kinase n=1 Tax=Streptosporangium sp. NBC_01469 TaxID=2903898 RepID=UPI002E2A8BCA|nr:HAMP domain-containing sensor histidine kinase [Streptosporangium sp. NBC_01469]